MAKKRHIGKGVQWCFPKRKRPFCESTCYASEFLKVMEKCFCEEYGRHPTIQELRDFLVYEGEETQILDKLILAGYGEELYNTWYD